MNEVKLCCPGCRRNVEALVPIANTQRCEDCAAIAELNGVYFDKAPMN